MYVVAFASFYALVRYRLRKPLFLKQSGLKPDNVEDLLFWAVLGVVIGGRIGYCLFYKPGEYLSQPLEILKVWQGGMSFHGGLLGVLTALLLYCKSRGKEFLRVTDLAAPAIPIGLAAGRMGNFINGELWGRETTVPWGMIFPQSGTDLVRHPSQLYQFAGEGILLFALLWWFSRKPRAVGQTSGLFLIGYGIFRFLAEFAREPDAFLGYLFAGATMGQLLCVPMILAGIWLYLRAKNS